MNLRLEWPVTNGFFAKPDCASFKPVLKSGEAPSPGSRIDEFRYFD
jgi:hypothetical protein